MPEVAIPDGLWAWAEHKGQSQASKRLPGDVVVAALFAARQADMTALPGLGTALQYLDMYAASHGGRIDASGLQKHAGGMANAVMPLLPVAEAMGFIKTESAAPVVYRWLGYGQ